MARKFTSSPVSTRARVTMLGTLSARGPRMTIVTGRERATVWASRASNGGIVKVPVCSVVRTYLNSAERLGCEPAMIDTRGPDEDRRMSTGAKDGAVIWGTTV